MTPAAIKQAAAELALGTTVNGVPVIGVRRIEWHDADDTHVLYMARVVGRAIVDFAGGGRSFGLVLSVWPTHAKRVVVIWERDTTRFACFPLEGEP